MESIDTEKQNGKEPMVHEEPDVTPEDHAETLDIIAGQLREGKLDTEGLAFYVRKLRVWTTAERNSHTFAVKELHELEGSLLQLRRAARARQETDHTGFDLFAWDDAEKALYDADNSLVVLFDEVDKIGGAVDSAAKTSEVPS
jgi:hypothetical protein